MEYEVRHIALVVAPVGEPIFSEQATTIRIDDEAAGEFLVVSQSSDTGPDNCIRIDPDEWPVLRDAIDRMHTQCRGDMG